jgi:hypothetical protein
VTLSDLKGDNAHLDLPIDVYSGLVPVLHGTL